MLISYTHKFIFFHIAKVAGLSIRAALQDYVQEPEQFKVKRPAKWVHGKPNLLYEMWASSLVHAKAREAQQALPVEIYHSFYKFAFVRNPWDWHVSMYHFLSQKELVTGDFEAYLDWVVSTPHPYPKGATKFQKDMLTDAQGHLIVDFVGRYETLAQDFKQVCHFLNLRTSLTHLNQTTHGDYRLYYNERTKHLVEEYFKEDIELFAYAFD